MAFNCLSSLIRKVQISNSGFLEDDDPMIKILDSLNRSSGLSARILFVLFAFFDFQASDISQNEILEDGLGFRLELFGVIWWSQSQDNGFWGPWSRPLGPLGPSIMNIETVRYFGMKITSSE